MPRGVRRLQPGVRLGPARRGPEARRPPRAAPCRPVSETVPLRTASGKSGFQVSMGKVEPWWGTAAVVARGWLGGPLAPGRARSSRPVPPSSTAWGFCRDVGARGRLAWTLTPGPSWAGQRWLTGSKAPDSGAAPVTFSQASRGLWEGASSERASITAYAWQGTRHGGRAGEWGAWGPPSPGQLCPRPFPAPHCPPAGPGSSREGRAKARGAGPARRPPALPAWERKMRGERAAGMRGPHKGSRGLLGVSPYGHPLLCAR